MDVRENTTGRDRDGAEELGKLFVVADRELDVARHDARLLVVARGVTREFEHFGAQVFLRGVKHNDSTRQSSSTIPSPSPRAPRTLDFKFQIIQKTTHHDSRQVHRRTGADARRVLASLQVARDPADRELQARLGGSARSLLAGFSFTSSRHLSCGASSCAGRRARARIASRSSARALGSSVSIGSRDARDESDSSRPPRERGIRTLSYGGGVSVRTYGKFGRADDGSSSRVVKGRAARRR